MMQVQRTKEQGRYARTEDREQVSRKLTRREGTACGRGEDLDLNAARHRAEKGQDVT